LPIKDFDYYLENELAKKASLDFSEAKSLFKQSKDRLEFTKTHEINEKNCSFLFESAYDSIREACQSLMSIGGFKPYSHEAVIAFLKKYYADEFSQSELEEFNNYRILRNNILYKAEKANESETKEALKFCIKIINKIQEIMKKQ
jgi:uncharacterized protein (UPF0332 family)